MGYSQVGFSASHDSVADSTGPATIDTSTGLPIVLEVPIDGKTVTPQGAPATPDSGVTFHANNNGTGFSSTGLTVSGALGSAPVIVPPSISGTTADALEFDFKTPTQASSTPL